MSEDSRLGSDRPGQRASNTRALQVRANGVDFHVVVEGSGPLVLLLHGFPDTPQTWDRARPALAAAGFRAATPFLRGYRPTGLAPDGRYDSDALGGDVLGLIEALGEERAIVVGHDWGADAAYAAAILGPARVRRLITVAIPHPASIRTTPRHLWAGRHFLTLRLPGAAARLARDDFAGVDELVRRWSPTWQVPADETRAVKALFADTASLDAALSYYRQLRFAAPRRITVPTFSFAGDDDTLNAAEFELARPLFTGPYTVIPSPGGHFLHREHPESFVPQLVELCRAA